MLYGDAVHGAWCNARTYPTTCRYCGKKVFYFSCDCGCRVLFDSLGWPWHKHDCQSPEAIIRQVDIDIEREYAERIARRQQKPREWEPPICPYCPEEGKKVSDLGLVREVNPVNVYKKFRMSPDMPLAPTFLGELAKNDLVQITVHASDLGSDTILSYTFLVKKSRWNRTGAIREDLLSFTIVGRAIPGREPYWLCTEIERL